MIALARVFGIAAQDLIALARQPAELVVAELSDKARHDHDPEQRADAYRKLHAAAPSLAGFFLERGIADTDWLVREAAAVLLGESGYLTEAPRLLESLLDAERERHPKVRCAAILSLDRLGAIKSPLRDHMYEMCLNEPDPVVRQALLKALQMDELQLDLVCGDKPRQLRAIAYVAASRDLKRSRTLQKLTCDPTTDPDVRSAALDAWLAVTQRDSRNHSSTANSDWPVNSNK
jgi:hypothetical protein